MYTKLFPFSLKFVLCWVSWLQHVSRSMGCSAERSFNQTMLLLEPFDSMMSRVNQTLSGLQDAARDVWKGLGPLDTGLGNIESDIYNGNVQLYGTGKTCRNLIERAHNSCTAGILSARDQCLGVIGALGSVYHHAREILDTINPDRWAPKQSLLQHRRQFNAGEERDDASLDDVDLPQDDSDICEPLSSLTVCHSLNNSSALCQPSIWAGDAIQDAINATRLAMVGLRQALQFSVSSEPYQRARVNASGVVFRIRQNVNNEFVQTTTHFLAVVKVLMKLVPLSIVILLHAAYKHVKLFNGLDSYDNVYVGKHFRTLDEKRCLASDVEASLLPLKKYERKYLADTANRALSEFERRMCCSGFSVYSLLFLITLFCFSFDFILYWILSLVGEHGTFGYEVTGSSGEDQGLVVAGEGLIVDLLDVFLKAFHPSHWPTYSGLIHLCLPEASRPSILVIIVVLFLHLAMLLTITLKAHIFRIRNEITAYFYAEREKERAIQLYRVVLTQRAHMQTRLHKIARTNHLIRINEYRNNPLVKIMMRFRCIRALSRNFCRCLVCKQSGDVGNFYHCATAECGSVYCKECISELEEVCSVCSPDNLLGFDSDMSTCDDLDDCLFLHSLACERYMDC